MDDSHLCIYELKTEALWKHRDDVRTEGKPHVAVKGDSVCVTKKQKSTSQSPWYRVFQYVQR